MPSPPKSLVALSLLLASGLVQGADPEPSTLAEMISAGTLNLDLRYRYEYVAASGPGKDANASTLRSRLTFASGHYRGFGFLVEMDDVTALGNDNYNSTANGASRYPVVADPEGTEINRALLEYRSGAGSASYGRQRILHGDQRFVGGVGWRQNEQTYDGFRAQWRSPAGIALDYAYIYNINRIFGPDDGAQPADWRGDSHLFRLDYPLHADHSIAGFAYLLAVDLHHDYSPNLSRDNSSDTWGLAYSGSFGPVNVRASLARQTDGSDSQLDYSASYHRLELEGQVGTAKLLAGYEVLGSDNGVGFKTPLATLHAFQGWTDQFLVTPGDGIEDLYLGVTGALGPIKLAATWHDFEARRGSTDFGSELDVSGTWPVHPAWTLQAKYAEFFADEAGPYRDIRKVWLTVNLKL